MFFFLQLSALQDWCETPLKPENSKVNKAVKAEENAESRKFLEAVNVMSVLADATCKWPTFLQIDLKLSESKARDQYLGQFLSTIEAFSQNYQENANNNGFVAVLTTVEQPLKRSRRATAVPDVSSHARFHITML